MRRLYVCDELEPLVAAALGELTGERTMEVLPALENLCLDELGRGMPWSHSLPPASFWIGP